MYISIKHKIAIVGAVALYSLGACFSLATAANVTPDVIFGSGNANGSFTVGTANNVEIGLRAKQRFPAANIFNYNGVDTYDFSAGESSLGSGRPLWNFEFSINTDVSGISGVDLADLTYELKLDTDPGAGTNFTSIFDPILGLPFFDHAIGDNSTGNGNGTKATDIPSYAILLANNNVAQNSWAFHWFAAIDPSISGLYGIMLSAFDQNGGLLSSSAINVRVSAVPLPASLPLYGAGIA
ncbi:MAG: hypothetical protein V7750_12055, partial [Sneathiella sp.]